MPVRVLLGTSNPAKVNRFCSLLAGYDVEFVTLRQLNITAEPAETGTTPAENARCKAEFYGRYFDRVLCNDSGLYFLHLPMEDARQPGLNIRSPQGVRLDDEAMIAYYAALVHGMGGRVPAAYFDGMAVYNNGTVTHWADTPQTVRHSAFTMVDAPSPRRYPGWPLDSISVNRAGRYFVDEDLDLAQQTDGEQILLGEYRRHLIEYLVGALGLTERT